MNNSVAEKLKTNLHQSLTQIGSLTECCLLNFPDYHNIGDHLIWLGEISYLTEACPTKIRYTAASIYDFSDEEMEKKAGKIPIIFQGGGNLGDLWKNHQEFREYVIAKYRDRPIIIMPQSIYFQNQENLKQAADIFNSHPNLTLFTRENQSYEIALKYFSNCQIFKTTDIAFQLANTSYLTSLNYGQSSSILYHCRFDEELNKDFSSAPIFTLSNVVQADWVSYQLGRPWKICESNLVNAITGGQVMGLTNELEFMLKELQPIFNSYPVIFNSLYNCNHHRISWAIMHCGIYQFKQHKMIITNRLHGHILCVILGIPHIFLANSYHKNQSFYESWTHEVSFCRFVKDSSEINQAAEYLLDKSSQYFHNLS
ncbi:polysaccharide pyruvyl transferase family protein [Gloeothece verrucosa]|uniref:Polysaccharide pyruvyl transferase n=1 Tax=Gloeothece verrucosa (strain PCC 7822) TaxID=497965 RepID=E0ULJ9_GLOV7|nr:polysaccharide pyruvyl transferase family protein [Gloeothece verrucosa]ADN17829.1 polysaccharide pyruvyl transferase [Gloeothece verrucosa PCC 7822]